MNEREPIAELDRAAYEARVDGASLESRARRAAAGDSQALSDLLAVVQQPVYRLALRFLGNPDDASDATQEKKRLTRVFKPFPRPPFSPEIIEALP